MAGVATGSGESTPHRTHRAPARRSQIPTFHLRLVGGFAATQDGRDIRLPAASRRLVAATALHAGPIPRHVAAERLWPHLEPRSALSSLRTALFRLNASSALLDTGPGYIALAEHVAVDVHALEAFARRLIDGPVPDTDAEESIRRLTMAILPDCDDDWLRLERDRLRDLFLHAIEAHATRLSAVGNYARALEAAHAALAADPVRETAAATLIAIHLAEGNRPQAVRTYRDFRARLRAIIDVEPADELRALVAPYLADD
ncbi:MAG: BTAD domain-containing putative transcriptional regulator [Dehalococcoidia bacterium]